MLAIMNRVEESVPDFARIQKPTTLGPPQYVNDRAKVS